MLRSAQIRANLLRKSWSVPGFLGSCSGLRSFAPVCQEHRAPCWFLGQMLRSTGSRFGSTSGCGSFLQASIPVESFKDVRSHLHEHVLCKAVGAPVLLLQRGALRLENGKLCEFPQRGTCTISTGLLHPFFSWKRKKSGV